MKSKSLQVTIFVIIAIVAILLMSTGLIVNVQWFQEVGYLQVFFTKVVAISQLLIPIFLIYFFVIWLYIKSLKKNILRLAGQENEKKVNKYSALVSIGIALVGAVSTAVGNWYKILQFTNSVPFNEVDPIFNKDISFYVFKLPLIQSVYDAIFFLMIILVGVTFVVYLGLNVKDKFANRMSDDNVISINPTTDGIKNFAGKQLAIVSSVLVILVGLGYILKAYYLVYSQRGVAYGASYTDVMITLKFYRVITIAAIVAGIIVFFSVIRAKFKPIIVSIAAIGVLIVLEPITALFVQNIIVKSNEMDLEKQYIQYNIDATKKAYNVDAIEENSFEPAKELTAEQLVNNQDILDNLKVNANEPVLNFYQQVQLIKNYYSFNDTDTDRYNINGDYSQVFIAPREINTENMTSNWQNKHLRYTHGYGVAMSEVNTVTSEGQPSFVMKDIPTVNLTDINLENPRIYYGEGDNDYVIVNTKLGEFDYPTGESENTFNYDGTGGIEMNFFNRILFSIYEQNPRILFSSSINEESKIIINKNIMERVKAIAPFLQYDSDPYVVIHDGRLVWMIDAYTVSDKYPFSEPYYGVNYIRNSVKIVVDAFNGTTDFYIVDETDPIAQSYSKIFKGLFKPMSEMPADLKDHFKYPQGIFNVQSEVLNKYHVNDPIKLFTQEDLWDKSKVSSNNSSSTDAQQYNNEILNQLSQSNQQTSLNSNANESLYLMTRLPGEENLEMMLFEYFNMKGKPSMVALLGARMDGDNYGKLIMYKFPQQTTTYSPVLFQNRIQQDPEISKEISLWEGKGSEVVYGDVIIVPIEDSLLYLNTIYLKASAENSMPEMKRVILSNGDKIVIEETVEKALETLFKYKSPSQLAPDDETIQDGNMGEEVTETPEVISGTVQEAADLFNKAMESQKNGDWAAYGEYIDNLGKLLESLNK